MTLSITKDQLKAEIDQVPTEKLETLHRFILSLQTTDYSSVSKESRESFIKKMSRIKIDAPPDFSRSVDLYLSGEKTLD